MKMRLLALGALCAALFWVCEDSFALRADEIPSSYTNISLDQEGKLYIKDSEGNRHDLKSETPRYTLAMLRGNPTGTQEGIDFIFRDDRYGIDLQKGKLYYGLINQGEGRYNLPVYYKDSSPISNGRATINITDTFTGRYDMTGWKTTARGTLGLRVADADGDLLYDGKISFVGKGPFEIDTCIIEGPFVTKMGPDSATISFETNFPAVGRVSLNGTTFSDSGRVTKHEIQVRGLSPNTTYEYIVSTDTGLHQETHKLTTWSSPGSRMPFCFAYASDSRAGQGGGERDIWGVNSYMLKKIMALITWKGVAFLQFTGDLIYGYKNSVPEQLLQYANWKRAIEPWAASAPVVPAMGNHESAIYLWDDGSSDGVACDRFPYDTESAESIFAMAFVNPENGPASEDGAAYDPDESRIDFPSYKENVFYYTCDNVAMVVLNSDYWFSYTMPEKTYVGGNPHGYIMDNQLAWLRDVLGRLEKDDNIDFIFITHHAPAFPNGGHVEDAMWYSGSNGPRPYVAGKSLDKGIIERRDEYWKILMEHSKVVAVLTGDDHNFNRLLVSKGMEIYEEREYAPDSPLRITRAIWQINNGAGGAPYHSRELTPWCENVQDFTTRNAVVFFHIHGKRMKVEVINPSTLEKID